MTTDIDWTELRQSLLKDGEKSSALPDVKMPILPQAVTKFSQRCDDPQATPKELGQIIETDSGLTCELLRSVNSAATGLRNKASSAQHAIAMLGIRRAKLFLLETAVKRAMRGGASKLVNIQNFWSATLERALLAREVAKLLKADPTLTYAAAMLQDFLIPLLTNELYDDYLEFTKEPDKNTATLPEYEQQVFKWDHAEAEARIMLQWGFPDDLICCVLLHHRGMKVLNDKQFGKTAVAAVAVSAMMPGPLRQVPNGLEQLVKLDQVWERFDLMAIAESVNEQFEAASPGTSNPFSFLRNCKKMLAAADS